MEMSFYLKRAPHKETPLAMPMYSLATIPLIIRLDGLCKQICYADDSAAIGTLEQLHAWWNRLATEGPAFGYFPIPSKTWLVTKQSHFDKASNMFACLLGQE